MPLWETSTGRPIGEKVFWIIAGQDPREIKEAEAELWVFMSFFSVAGSGEALSLTFWLTEGLKQGPGVSRATNDHSEAVLSCAS